MTDMPAEVFSPGEYLRDELLERGWTATEFAEIIGRPLQAVSEIVNDKKEITTETAVLFEQALGVSAGTWLSLQNRYRLFMLRTSTHDGGTVAAPVARRAHLRSLVPLAELRKRGWVSRTDDLDVIESEVRTLLKIESLYDQPQFAMAAKRTNVADQITIEQRAWLAYIQRIAETRKLASYDQTLLSALAASVPRRLQEGPEQLADLRDAFAECGVALVVVGGLKGGKLDGAVTSVNGCPVIGLTARGDRFDSFIHTLLHECGHLVLNHLAGGSIVDDDVTLDDVEPIEAAANKAADQWLFPGGFPDVEATIRNVADIAEQFGIHPSVVIGRFQWRNKAVNPDSFKFMRTHIPKVREYIKMDVY